MTTVGEFIEEMRSGRYYPSGSFIRGEMVPFWDEPFDDAQVHGGT